MQRQEILDRVRKREGPWDIIVIGGGATGVGCALDAASRGYDVLLLEQHDFGKGTSSRSTKLVHGGVRYLRQGNLSMVREALRERGRLLQNAPHVVYKCSFIVPCYSLWQKLWYGTGLRLYDLLAGKTSFGRSQILSRKETLERLPGIANKGLSGGVLYYDGQFDDTRLLIDLASTARSRGATVINYTKVVSLTKSAEGKVSGVRFEDAETLETFDATARAVINATGVFCDGVRSMSDATAKPVVTFSQGIHLVFRKCDLPIDNAVMIPKTSDGRVLFCIPWQGYTLVGTTDTPVGSATLEPQALESEIDFVLKTVERYFAASPTRSDISSVFAGIRPLVNRGRQANTASISRGHDLFVDDAGLVTITGGKWTTYRQMAADAVDQAAETGGLERHSSITADLPISQPPHRSDGTEQLAKDVAFFVRDEMARTVEDVLARRTRRLFLDAGAAIEIAPMIAELIAKELGKDGSWVAGQTAGFIETAKNYLPDGSSISV